MAAPSYSTDLAIHDDATSAANFSEPTGMTDLDGSGVDDTDLAIYGTQCVSESMRKTALGALVTGPAARTLGTNEAFFVWFKWFAPNSLANKANGGIRVLIGNTTANYYGWYVDGADTYQYGGWKNYCVDPRFTNDAQQQQGTPNTTYQQVGIGVNCPIDTPQKGNSYTIDIIRYGRGQLLITDGDGTLGYANFDSAALFNDSVNGRYGLFQDQGGSYLWKGLLSLGSSTTAVDFRDQNVTINIDNTEYVDSDFNRIEISNAGSNVEWTGISISSLSARARGNLQMVDGAAVSMNGCNFNDMGYFNYNRISNVVNVSSTSFRRCNVVRQGGATFTDCVFEDTNDSAYALHVSDSGNDLSLISGCTFTARDQGLGANHAIRLGPVNQTKTISLDNVTLEGYTAGATGTFNGVTGGDSAAIEVGVTTGNTLTINVVNGSTTPSIQNTDTGTVVVQAAVTVSITGLLGNSEIKVLPTAGSPYSGNSLNDTLDISTENVSADTFIGNGTDYISYNTGGSNVSIDTTNLAFSGVLNDGDIAATALTAGDIIRVTIRDNDDNSSLQLFDQFEVSGTPTSTSIATTTLSSGFVSVFGTALTGSNSKTVTVEKVNASYQFSVSSGTEIDFLVFRTGSIPIQTTQQTITADNRTFPLSQSGDRNFDNP